MKVVDMHCDTISKLFKKQRQNIQEDLYQNTGHLDLKRMQQSGYLLQNFALFVNLNQCKDPWEEVTKLHDCFVKELQKNKKILGMVLQYADIEKNNREKKMSAMLTVEEGAVCRGSLAKLDRLYSWGVRMLTLTWNYPNELGWPAKVSDLWKWDEQRGQMGEGLSEKGLEFLDKMEKLGMIVDVSHLSDQGFWEVAEHAKKPFVASHSNARSICSHARNMTDEMIRKLGESGGCMGLNFYRDFLVKEKNESALEAMVLHAKHIVDVGGIEVLGLGSDFDGIDTNEELQGVQNMDLLQSALQKGGFSMSQIEQFFSRNVLRVYRDVLR